MCTFGMPFSIDLCNLSTLSLFHLTFPIELNWIADSSLNLFQKLSLVRSSFLPIFIALLFVFSTFIPQQYTFFWILFFWCRSRNIVWNKVWTESNSPSNHLHSFLFNRCLYSREKNYEDDISILQFPGIQFGLFFAPHISVHQFKWLPTKTIYIIIWRLKVVLLALGVFLCPHFLAGNFLRCLVMGKLMIWVCH